MKNNLYYACINQCGFIRKKNEDNFFLQGVYRRKDEEEDIAVSGKILLRDKKEIVGVFDGMGGEACGEVASFLAASTLQTTSGLSKKPKDTILQLCELLNQKVCDYSENNGVQRMGTTLACVLFDKKRWHAFNIGDSRIYVLSHGHLSCLTTDHISPENNGRKGALLQYLGLPENEYHLRPGIREMKYHNNDLILICTDGLTDMVSDEDIAKILEKDESEEQLAWHLCERALQNGGRDNITLILLRVKKSWF